MAGVGRGKVQGLWDFVRSSVKPCLVEKGVVMEMLKGDNNCIAQNNSNTRQTNTRVPLERLKRVLASRTLPLNYFFLKMLLTLALWLNLLSSHFTTIPGPPNGVIGLYSRSTVHTSSSLR